jgi:hypothetical protein
MANTAARNVNDNCGRAATGGRHGSRRWLTVFVLWLFLFVLPISRLLHAHGDHGDAAPPEGGISLISFDGFQAELLTFPRPPRAGEEIKIVIKIVREHSFEPVRNGAVLMAVGPAALSRGGTGTGAAFVRTRDGVESLPLIALQEVTWVS